MIRSPAGIGRVLVSRPEDLQQTMRGLVEEGKLAGVTTLVARHGKVVHFDVTASRIRIEKPVTEGHHLPHRVHDQADRAWR